MEISPTRKRPTPRCLCSLQRVYAKKEDAIGVRELNPQKKFARPFCPLVESGEYRLHYALTLARDLPSAIAGSYGIVQRRNLAVLTVALTPRDPRAAVTIREPAVEATAIGLTGERRQLALSRRDEPGGATWLARVEVRHRVPIAIAIRARATPEGPELRARLTREFRLE